MCIYYSFHDGGWNYGSVAARNILVQKGPLSVWPTFQGPTGARVVLLTDD